MNDKTLPYLSIIIPAYKEEKRIETTLLDLKRYFSNKEYLYEIIVVNDGSPDGTARILKEYQKTMPGLVVVDNEKNMGKGYAVRCGMLRAKGHYRLFMDADNSVRIDEVEEFIKQMKENRNDLAIGSIAFTYATTTEHNGWHRRFLGSLSKTLVRIIAVPNIYDTQRGFKVFTAQAADLIFPKQKIHRFGFDIELLVIAQLHNLSIIELPVEWDNPAGSTVGKDAYIKTFGELCHIFMNKIGGLYYPKDFSYGKRLGKSARAILEIGSICIRAVKEITVSRMHLHIKLFDAKKTKLKGCGLIFKGQEFIHHTALHHSETALYSFARIQKFFIGLGISIFCLCLTINWHTTLVVSISAITLFYFFDLLFSSYLIIRSFSRNPEIKISSEEIDTLSEEKLPVYTIFCPLYREWQVVPQFVKAMNELNYPRHKLQIIFLLEENDRETIEKTRNENLPFHFEIIVVPHSKPKTKPKAMNYGLSYVRGKYLVIFDAEDMPERDQLKKTVIAFSKVSPETVCIQAKLNFYNIEQNVLTRAFTAEYSLWFDLILPGLQSLNAPIPLGGTSNHFRTDTLKNLKGWDAFNVTEDCDLGMRLAKEGFRTAIVESTTYEEANSDIRNWYNQRSRWIKGYIQTYFVHMRNPQAFKRGLKDMLAFQIVVGGKIFSILINPIFWFITLCYFVFRTQAGTFIESFFPTPILYIGVTSFIFGNFLYLYNYMIGCAKRKFDYLIKYVFVVPFYWFGMSVAGWRGLYEVFVKPHYWSKTIHGLHLNSAVLRSQGK